MKKFSDYILEELEDKATRTFKWLNDNADAIKDWMSDLFDCEVYFSKEYGGMIIIPDEDLVEVNDKHKEEFADMFGREFTTVFPNKYKVNIKNEEVIITSPFKEGSKIPELKEED